jgi:hypothetical protein
MKQKGKGRNLYNEESPEFKAKNKSGFWTKAILEEFRKRDRTKID